MLKLGDLLGLPVLEVETGAQIGSVQEAVLDSNLTSVKCILVTGSANGSGSKQILFHDLLNIGRDAITVRNSSVMFSDDLSAGQECTTQLHELLQKEIFTETGRNLGVLVDIIYDVASGKVQGYEVSDGIITDLICGRLLMPLPQAQVVGEDKVIVPDAMASLLQDRHCE